MCVNIGNPKHVGVLLVSLQTSPTKGSLTKTGHTHLVAVICLSVDGWTLRGLTCVNQKTGGHPAKRLHDRSFNESWRLQVSLEIDVLPVGVPLHKPTNKISTNTHQRKPQLPSTLNQPPPPKKNKNKRTRTKQVNRRKKSESKSARGTAQLITELLQALLHRELRALRRAQIRAQSRLRKAAAWLVWEESRG